MGERRAVGSYDDYRDAVRAAEFLAAQGLEPARIRIDGEDVRPAPAPRSRARRLAQAAAALIRALASRPDPAPMEAARYTVVVDRVDDEDRRAANR